MLCHQNAWNTFFCPRRTSTWSTNLRWGTDNNRWRSTNRTSRTPKKRLSTNSSPRRKWRNTSVCPKGSHMNCSVETRIGRTSQVANHLALLTNEAWRISCRYSDAAHKRWQCLISWVQTRNPQIAHCTWMRNGRTSVWMTDVLTRYRNTRVFVAITRIVIWLVLYYSKYLDSEGQIVYCGSAFPAIRACGGDMRAPYSNLVCNYQSYYDHIDVKFGKTKYAKRSTVITCFWSLTVKSDGIQCLIGWGGGGMVGRG